MSGTQADSLVAVSEGCHDGGAPETTRLVRLWAGSFGQAYTERNATAAHQAGADHEAMFQRLGVRSVLEVGCNLGLNLTRMAANPGFTVTGIDVCHHALVAGRKRLARAMLAQASAYDLPFADGAFDMVFTCGVLIHVPPAGRERAMREIHRASRRYIWCGEYFSDADTVIPYRGESRALFKCDYGALYATLFPGLRLCDRGFWGKAETGFDDITWWLFEKP